MTGIPCLMAHYIFFPSSLQAGLALWLVYKNKTNNPNWIYCKRHIKRNICFILYCFQKSSLVKNRDSDKYMIKHIFLLQWVGYCSNKCNVTLFMKS